LTPKKLKKISDNLKKEINKNLEVEMMINVKKEVENVIGIFNDSYLKIFPHWKKKKKSTNFTK
jgi:hypothetical protein